MQRVLRRYGAALGAALTAMLLGACGGSGPGAKAGATNVGIADRGPAAGDASYREAPAGIATVQLFHPMSEYTQYVAAKLAALRPQLAALSSDLTRGDLSGARRAWLVAHLTWLEIGQDDGQYGAFGALGGDIDGLSDGDVGGSASPRFTGFHRVERDLFVDHDVTAARAATARLIQLVDSVSPATLQTDLALTNTRLDAWVLRTHEILEDALRDSLSGEDNYGSDSDLDSVRADVSATREMLAVLAGLIAPRAPRLLGTAERQLSAIDAALASAPAGVEPASLPLRTRQRIDGSVGAALETLAPVSELIQITNANS